MKDDLQAAIDEIEWFRLPSHYEVESEPEVVRRVRLVDRAGRKGEWSTDPDDWPASVREIAGRTQRRTVAVELAGEGL